MSQSDDAMIAVLELQSAQALAEFANELEGSFAAMFEPDEYDYETVLKVKRLLVRDAMSHRNRGLLFKEEAEGPVVSSVTA